MLRGPGVVAVASCLWIGCAGGQSGSNEVELLTDDPRNQSDGLGAIRLGFPWELNNPTAADATVDAAEWTLTVIGGEPQNGQTTIGTSASPGGTGQGVLTVEAPIDTSQEAFTARDADPVLKYTMVATFDVKTGSGLEAFEAQWHGELFAPQRVAVKVDAQAGRHEGSGTNLYFTVSLDNANSFPVIVEAFNYKLSVAEIEIAAGNFGEGSRIGQASQLQFDVQRFAGGSELKDLAKKIKGASTIPYELSYTLTVSGVTFEDKSPGNITFNK